jgi:O-antigen/teichoic acid export membrane protein
LNTIAAAVGLKKPARVERVFVAYAGSSSLQSAATILSGILILRWIGPTELGVWQSVLVIQAYLTVLRFGIPNALNREMPFHLGRGETALAHQYAETTLLHALLVGSINFVAFATAWPFLAGKGISWQWAVGAGGIVAAAASYRTYLLATFRSSDDFGSLSVVQFANAATTLLLPVAAWRFGFAGLCIHAAMEAVFITAFAHRIRPLRVRPRFRPDCLRTLLHAGTHLFVTSYLFTAALTFDRLILLMRGDVTLVGYYAPAMAISGAMAVLPNAVAIYVYPRLSFAHGKGASANDLWRTTSQSMWLSALLGMPLALAVITVLPWLTRTAFPQYVPSLTVMQLAAVTGVFMGMTTTSAVLRSLKAWRPLYAFIITFVVLRFAIPFLLSGMMDPLHGVAIGSLLASGVAAVHAWFVARTAVFQVDIPRTA